MLITAYYFIRPDGHQDPRNKVGSESLVECSFRFEPGIFRSEVDSFLPIQPFIQTVLLVSVLNKDWVFECCEMLVDDTRCCKLCNEFMAEPWWGCRGVKALKKCGLLTFEGNINSLKQEKSSQLICFECKLNANMLWNKISWRLSFKVN